jgi:glycosyltransferase involved in cell wall biosynthesis
VISIIIPAINEEKLLGRMLEQFSPELVQNYDLEIIVSDGGSTDRTCEVARKYAHTVVENLEEKKQTISVGRNLGASKARGDLLIFLNADTRIAEPAQFFDRVREEMQRPGVAGLTCRVEVYPEEQRWIDLVFHSFYNWFFERMNDVGIGMGRGECHVVPKAIFEKIHGYSPRIAAGEDYDLFSRLRKLGAIRFLDDLVVYESPRRYRKYGYAYVSASWFLNYLAIVLLRRSILSEWRPVR